MYLTFKRRFIEIDEPLAKCLHETVRRETQPFYSVPMIPCAFVVTNILLSHSFISLAFFMSVVIGAAIAKLCL